MHRPPGLRTRWSVLLYHCPLPKSTNAMKDTRHLTLSLYFDSSTFTSGAKRGAYNILHLLSGSASFTINHCPTSIQAGELIFLNPLDEVECQAAFQAIIQVCRVEPEYFDDQPHLSRLFAGHMLFNHVKVVKKLTRPHAQLIAMLFRLIRQEERSIHDDRKEAILVYLQMLLLLANRFRTSGQAVSADQSYLRASLN
jgi:AraC family transcriptional activator of pobA